MYTVFQVSTCSRGAYRSFVIEDTYVTDQTYAELREEVVNMIDWDDAIDCWGAVDAFAIVAEIASDEMFVCYINSDECYIVIPEAVEADWPSTEALYDWILEAGNEVIIDLTRGASRTRRGVSS